jgi:predicted amidophosphoribosyltransferase
MGPYFSTKSKHQTGSPDYLSRDIYFLKNNPYKAEPLGLGLAACIRRRYPELLAYDFLVAVPQHPDELHVNEHTGDLFNPIDSLVSWLNSDVGIKVITPLTKTRPQKMKGLNYHERREATEGLYNCNSDEVAQKRILLVDDVATTSSTLDRCAEALMKSKAVEVSAIVCGKEYLG